MVLHPRFLFGCLEPAHYEQYKELNHVRSLQSYKAMSEMMVKHSLVKIKEHPPYAGDMESKVLLNSMARATFNSKTGEYSFKANLITEAPMDTANVKTISDIAAAGGLASASDVALGVGVDQGLSHPLSPITRN